LISRLLGWLGRVLNDLFGFFRGSAPGRTITYVLIGLLVFLVVARLVIAARTNRDDRILTKSRGSRARTTDPWSDAQQFAAAGRYTDAAHALFSALLDRFAAQGDVRLHASKTAGDYARELRRRRSPGVEGFQAFRSRYDRIVYGAGECTSDDYESLLRHARTLVGRERPA
jgi:hypothetical protein